MCSENAVVVQSSDSGAPTFKLPLPENYSAPCCCFSPDGNLIAVASNEVTYVWNIAHSVPKLVATFSDHDNIITSLTFTSPFPSYQDFGMTLSSSSKLGFHPQIQLQQILSLLHPLHLEV